MFARVPSATQSRWPTVQRLRKALVLLQRPLWRAGLRHGVAAAIEHYGPLAGLPVRTVIDIGANRGQFSLFCAEVFPNARIHAFEPLRAPAERFRRVLGNNSRISLHPIAVGPESGTAEFYVSKKDDSSSLLPITQVQEHAFPGTGLARVEHVEVAPLSSVLRPSDLDRPVLLKLDVQGYEYQALRASEDLLTVVRWVYVECSFVELYEGQSLAPAIEEYLEAQGYTTVVSSVSARDAGGGVIQSDVLFERRGSHLSPVQSTR